MASTYINLGNAKQLTSVEVTQTKDVSTSEIENNATLSKVLCELQKITQQLTFITDEEC